MNEIGSPIGALLERPPYIRFEVRSIEKHKPASEGAGVYFVDEVFALVTPHGSKDTTEKICSEWFPRLKEEVRQGRFDPRWYEAYYAAFVAFRNDQEPPINGISIKNWPAATPSEVKMLVALRCLTVEDLAAANEELVGRIGMGARSLVQRAKDYLVAKNGTGALTVQMDALRQTVIGLETQVRDLREGKAKLEAQLEYKTQTGEMRQRDGLPPVEDQLAQARASIKGPSDDDLITDAIAEA